jgi:midasin
MLNKTSYILNLDKNKLIFKDKRKPIMKYMNDVIMIGRASLQYNNYLFYNINYSPTQHSLFTIEKIAMSLENKEPLLLVGETGIGKTSIIQYLSKLVNANLSILNLNNETDFNDLFGGFKPISIYKITQSIIKHFMVLSKKTFKLINRTVYEKKIEKYILNKSWKLIVDYLLEISNLVIGEHTISKINIDMIYEWKSLKNKIELSKKQMKSNNSFMFMEGILIKAIRKGSWILLDEINLADPTILQGLEALLDGQLVLLDNIKSKKNYQTASKFSINSKYESR